MIRQRSQHSRRWKSRVEVEAVFHDRSDPLVMSVLSVCDKMDRLTKDVFLRDSAALHGGKEDKRLQDMTCQMDSYFDRFVETAYVSLYSEDEKLLEDAKVYMESFVRLLEQYEKVIYRLVLRRIKGEAGARDELEMLFRSLMNHD